MRLRVVKQAASWHVALRRRGSQSAGWLTSSADECVGRWFVLRAQWWCMTERSQDRTSRDHSYSTYHQDVGQPDPGNPTAMTICVA